MIQRERELMPPQLQHKLTDVLLEDSRIILLTQVH